MSKSGIWIRAAISMICVIGIVIHVTRPTWLPADSISIGLLILAAFPWLIYVIEEAEFPGGWKVKFREVKREQERQAQEIQWLKFLMRNFLGPREIEHLKRLSSGEPYWIAVDSKSSPYLERELRRLLELNLIERRQGRGIRAFFTSPEGIRSIDGTEKKDLKDYLNVTVEGLEYLRLREQSADNS